MSNRHYILDQNKEAIEVPILEWAQWFEKTNDRHVAETQIDGVRVSTVFLGLDHRWDGDAGPPLIFETMVFGGPDDEYQTRCSTWKEAETEHNRVVSIIQAKKRLFEEEKD